MTDDQKDVAFRAAVDAARVVAEESARGGVAGPVEAAEIVISAAQRAAEMINEGAT